MTTHDLIKKYTSRINEITELLKPNRENWMDEKEQQILRTERAIYSICLRDIESLEASAPLSADLEEAAKEAAEHYIEDETLQFQTVCHQQGYSLDIIEEWAKVDYRKGFLAGSRYQPKASLPGDIVGVCKNVWQMAMTYAYNLCVNLSNQYNNDDQLGESTA